MSWDYEAPAFVYLVTNRRNGNRYVGVTTKAPTRRLGEHLNLAARGFCTSKFYRAIRKYGPDAFFVVPLLPVFSLREALRKEIGAIAELQPE
jgi:predicted GIY-YIG superfamily endonuclease